MGGLHIRLGPQVPVVVLVLGAGVPSQRRENRRARWRPCGIPLALYVMPTEEKDAGKLHRLNGCWLFASRKLKPFWTELESQVLDSEEDQVGWQGLLGMVTLA